MPTIAQLDHLVATLEAEAWCETGLDVPLRWAEAAPADRDHMLDGPHHDWRSVGPATIWGRPQSYFWFSGRFTVPEALEGADLWLRIDAQFGRVMGRSDPQCLVRINGEIAQGGDYNHRLVRLSDAARTGARFDIMIEAGTIEDRHQIGFALTVLTRDAEMEMLFYDLATPLDVARHLPETDHRRDRILGTVYAALNVVDLRPGNPDRRAGSVRAARQVARSIYETADTEAVPTITVTGHTHIDVAWLWRVRETRQKMARSVATVLGLMEEYPDYIFMYNQGFLLDALARDYPELFQRLKARQAGGQVEIEGALWLEPDANMTGGESLVRHILKGIRYHQETFGIRPRIVWLPDTFGYSAALPQIMALAGLDVFVTHKMSWNDTNRMPHEIFWWEGLDGTRAPTYFLTTQPVESTSIGTTYCPDLRPSHVMGAWRRFSQKADHDRLWLVYGHGDGGGGPTRGMLEQIRRMERGIPGCPRVEHGPMGPFFTDLVERMQADPGAYPAWVGELYLEFHRGTFTSVAEVKRNNRRAEAVLRDLEALAVLAMVRAGVDAPRTELAALWDIVLLNQFHDILPGSSIAEVYADSRADFETFFAQASDLEARLAAELGGDIVLNALGAPRGGLVSFDARESCALDGAPSQVINRADGTVAHIAPLPPVPVAGARRVTLTPAPAATGTGGLSVGTGHLENVHLRAEFDTAGRLTSLSDKGAGREILAGPANRLVAFRDRPAQFDAWDIDPTYLDQMWEIDDLQRCEVVETGPYRAALRLEWAYERSRIVQVISLGAEARELEVDCYIDWAEPHTLVKAAFPLALRTNASVAETQFGHVTRASHRNTSWDQAKFELPMLRWVAMTDGDFGLALFNDCKYGYDAEDATLRLTLLRAPTWPWDGADIGVHRLRYAIALHHGIAELPARAEAFNHPPRLLRGGAGAMADLEGIVSLDGDAVALEAIKPAEDGDAIVLRLWERHGAHTRARLRFDACIASVSFADLLETPQAEIALDGKNETEIEFAPFKIVTLRLERRRTRAQDTGEN
ncbi:alpha-mannosidase [Roseibium sp. Sym1]|uniref:alpha-mannosidase n=1 Tax=Roseibium sp. Sym1 TaxID=3016006 RepID=UPI0022B5237C|nr:glycoside hydrolase family 38 C-terminal domain-containing protein [Roseibium sp. Sym1]